MERKRLFADYVLKESPTTEDVVAALDALRAALRGQMHRRGVLAQRPSAWGYSGSSWRDEDTFNDLLYHCFQFVFLGKRKDRLRHYARGQPSIDGAVIRSVVNFLNELEKRKDPRRHAVFKNVIAAAADALDSGRFVAVAGGTKSRITNQTVIACTSSSVTALLPRSDLARQVNASDNAASLFRNMTSRGRRGLEAAVKVVSRLADVQGSWRVGDLVAVVSERIPGEIKEHIVEDECLSLPAGDPDVPRQLDEDESLAARCERTRAAIAALNCNQRVRERLRGLWDWMIAYYHANGLFPGQHAAVEEFGQDRRRVSDDYERLKPLVKEIWGDDPDK